MEPGRQEPEAPLRQAPLGLWDTICIIIGIMMGTGIYRTPGEIFALTNGPLEALGLWLAGGVLAIAGAFCFAELASTYPRSGGEYVYLTRAFGSMAGFLFAWGQLLFIRTGASMVMMAVVFADFACRLARIDSQTPNYRMIQVGLILLPMILLTFTNILGVKTGKWTQNILTTAKVLGLGMVVFVGFWWAGAAASETTQPLQRGTVLAATPGELVLATGDSPQGRRFSLARDAKITIDGNQKNASGTPLQPGDLQGMRAKVAVSADDQNQAVRVKATNHSYLGALSLALLFVLWTYAGWHEAAYVTAEVRDKRRIVPASLIIGTMAVIVLYMLINTAYLAGLGYETAADSKTVAADVLALVPGDFGERAICVLIIISSLGAINGMIFTSSRIYSAFGTDHKLFAPLGRWNERLGTPIVALLVQGFVAVTTILLVELLSASQDRFRVLMNGTSPVFYLFFLLTGFALFALRSIDRNIQRPFSAPLYPLTPLLYCAICGMMLYGSVVTAWDDPASWNFVLFTVVAVLAGIPLFWLSQFLGRHQGTKKEQDANASTAAH